MADGPKLTPLGKLFIFLFIAGCAVGAYYFFTNKSPFGSSSKNTGSSDGILGSLGSGDQIEVGITYGTEKQRWLEWAVQEFAKTRDGKRIKMNLIPMGTLEGPHPLINPANAIQL